MPVLATRPRQLALAFAVITAVTLGTVGASAATTSGTSDASTDTDPPRHGRGIGPAYTPTDEAPDDVNEANRAFAACMRDAGQERFPDFHAYKADDGSIRLKVTMKGGPFDPVAKEYRKAIKKCAPLLKEAGIAFPATPDLPRPPRHPDERGHAERPGHSERPGHTEPGRSGTVESI